MGAVVLFMILLIYIGGIYPLATITYFKLVKKDKKTVKQILDEIGW